MAKRAWSDEEDCLLLEQIQRHGTGNWNTIALQVGRDQRRCRERWFNHLDPNCRKGHWSPEEDVLIDTAVEQLGQRWTEIAKLLPPGRTGESVKKRYKRPRTGHMRATAPSPAAVAAPAPPAAVLAVAYHPVVQGASLAKRAWSDEEDCLLLEQIQRHGTGNWNTIALQVGRDQRRCRERWFNHLDPNCRKGHWSPEEDVLIDTAVEQLGQRWTEIAKLLPPGRTGESVKNRYKRPRTGHMHATAPSPTAVAAPAPPAAVLAVAYNPGLSDVAAAQST